MPIIVGKGKRRIQAYVKDEVELKLRIRAAKERLSLSSYVARMLSDSCKEDNDVDARTLPESGTQFPATNWPNTPCPLCGEKLDDFGLFITCTSCGAGFERYGYKKNDPKSEGTLTLATDPKWLRYGA